MRHACSQQPLSVQTSHPDWMVERWQNQYGEAIAEQICIYNNQIPKVHLVFNPKFDMSVILADLKEQQLNCLGEKNNGWIVSNRLRDIFSHLHPKIENHNPFSDIHHQTHIMLDQHHGSPL